MGESSNTTTHRVAHRASTVVVGAFHVNSLKLLGAAEMAENAKCLEKVLVQFTFAQLRVSSLIIIVDSDGSYASVSFVCD